MLRTLLVSAALLVAGSTLFSANASGSASTRAFYLTVHPRQCLIVSSADGKHPALVPCSNPRHDLEVYAIGHGGWGHARPPANATALAIARSVCLAAYQRITGHALGSAAGWNAFWPDPGAETARYADKIICGYRTWPQLRALGAGWHVR